MKRVSLKQVKKMVSNQVKWAAEMFKAYIKQEGSLDAYVRGCHYFIVKLSKEKRLMPARKAGTFREYQNTKSQYKRLSEMLVDARIAELIDWNAIVDRKNEELRIGCSQRDSAKFIESSSNSQGLFGIETMKARDFDEFINDITFGTTDARFNHQSHRLVVIVEKAKAKTSIEAMARYYGADCIQFGGQHSMTRLHQICQNARNEEKPLRVLYISDLDVAGWFMPIAAERRIQEIYPHDDLDVIRVMLTREQVEEYNLPVSFDPDIKRYPDGQIQRFIDESGSRDCIEADAIGQRNLLKILDKTLEEYAGFDEDREETKEFRTSLKEKVSDLDLQEYRRRYEVITENFNQALDKFLEHQELIDELKDHSRDLRELELKIDVKVDRELKENGTNEESDQGKD